MSGVRGSTYRVPCSSTEREVHLEDGYRSRVGRQEGIHPPQYTPPETYDRRTVRTKRFIHVQGCFLRQQRHPLDKHLCDEVDLALVIHAGDGCSYHE